MGVLGDRPRKKYVTTTRHSNSCSPSGLVGVQCGSVCLLWGGMGFSSPIISKTYRPFHQGWTSWVFSTTADQEKCRRESRQGVHPCHVWWGKGTWDGCSRQRLCAQGEEEKLGPSSKPFLLEPLNEGFGHKKGHRFPLNTHPKAPNRAKIWLYL